MSSWLEQQNADLTQYWAGVVSIPLVTSLADGRILWCNAAFEEFIGYTEFELTQGNGGKGITWDQISINDGSLQADRRMVEELVAGRRQSYTIRKQYIPKNEKPLWVDIQVVRYPAVGDVDFFLVTVQPLKNGAQAASQIMHDQMSIIVNKLDSLDTKFTSEGSTDTEKIAGAMARIIVHNPKASMFVILVALTMILGAQLLQAVDSVKRMLAPTVVVAPK